MLYTVRPFRIESVKPPENLGEFSPRAFTANRIPLDIEVGCGVGWHSIRYAKENPDRKLIAIEHTRAKYESFYNRVIRHPDLKNLVPIHADAIRWVTHALGRESIDRCFLLYPNPEPKAMNKRWFRMPFMHRLLGALRVGGEVTLATNEEAYWQEALEWAREYWKLELIEARSFKSGEIAGGPRTHFEKKYLDRGQTCYDMRVRKINACESP